MIDSAEYALNITGSILNYYERFFGVEYPLPKMDMIALPDFNAGAMENWGLITYRENAMLHDSYKASVLNKQRIATVVAHELAHQWFGNLVTPKWWDDLWLNEGFATFVEFLGVDYIEPEWRIHEQFVTEELHDCLKVDSLPSSHQISIPVNSPQEINEIFDYISYMKGGAVIRMMEHFLTRPIFTKGLNNYLKTLKYSNAEQADLWRHLTEAQENDSNRVDIGPVMNTWTLQVGYPIVTLERKYDGKQVATLKQVKYDPIKAAKNISLNSDVRWEIPITMTHRSSNEDNDDSRVKLWLHQNDTQPVEVPKRLLPKHDNDWVLLNVNQVGYYRVNYDKHNWNLIIEQLIKDHNKFSAISRAQIIDDLFDMAKYGIVDYALAMNATKYLPKERDFSPWDSLQTSLSFIDIMLQRTSIYGDWITYMNKLMEPKYRHFNDSKWTIDETKGKGLKMNDVIWALDLTNTIRMACHLGNEDCISKSKYLFSEWKRTGENKIDPTFRSYVYAIAIEHGSTADWDFLWNVYKKEEFASERDRLLRALCKSRDYWILSRLLDWAFLKQNSDIRRQDAVTVFNSISAGNQHGRNVAFDFLSENWATIRDR